MLFWNGYGRRQVCVVGASSAQVMPATTCGRNRSSPLAGELQQLGYLLWREWLGDVLVRDRILHHLVEAFDLLELQHRLGIEAVAHGLRHGSRYLRIFRERLDRLWVGVHEVDHVAI